MSGSTFRSALLALLLGAACEHPSVLLTVSRAQAPERNPNLFVCESATDPGCDNSYGSVFPSPSDTSRTFGLFGGDGPIWIKLRDDGGTGVAGSCVRASVDAPNEEVQIELQADGTFTRTCAPEDCGTVELCQ